MPKVSIIIGLYNVEKFLLEGRLSDIYAQTYRDWELILVDDGSTDGTGAYCDAEAERDERIKVIHKENGGLGSARNAGLEIARGEYICSMDVDDHVESNMLEHCVREMDARSVDMMMFGFWAHTPQFGTCEEVHLQELEIHTQEELKSHYLERILFIPNGNGFFWNKCYRKSFLDKYNIRFGNQLIQQDEVFNINVYQHLEHCYISPGLYYHYYIYSKGNTRSNFIPNRYEIYSSVISHYRALQNLWAICDARFEEYLMKRVYGNLHALLRYNMMHPNCAWSRQEKIAELSRVMSDPEYVRAIAYQTSMGISVEDRLFLLAYRAKSLALIRVFNSCFALLRVIWRMCNLIPFRNYLI